MCSDEPYYTLPDNNSKIIRNYTNLILANVKVIILLRDVN